MLTAATCLASTQNLFLGFRNLVLRVRLECMLLVCMLLYGCLHAHVVLLLTCAYALVDVVGNLCHHAFFDCHPGEIACILSCH